jgi:hypothetical protein
MEFSHIGRDFTMFTQLHRLCLSGVFVILSGCAVEQTEAVDTARSEVLAANVLAANVLAANVLAANVLAANALTSSPLSTETLSDLVQAALQDQTFGANDRTLFHYVATCALAPSQSVSYTWSDAQGPHAVVEQGLVGLAPDWATGPLSLRGQQLVSACVASRVNAFGITVHISLRNHVIADDTSDAELAAYPHVEGAFWGNLFSSKPHLSSCYDAPDVAYSLADHRACATGYTDANGVHQCGMINLTGSCTEQCRGFDTRGQFYVGCGEDHTMNAVTVGLQ